MKSTLISMLISMLMAYSALTALAQDHSRAQSAVDSRLLVENEFVQVVRISIPPHGKTPMHDVSPRVVVWMADAHSSIITPTEPYRKKCVRLAMPNGCRRGVMPERICRINQWISLQ
jgi:hypothetical protein